MTDSRETAIASSLGYENSSAGDSQMTGQRPRRTLDQFNLLGISVTLDHVRHQPADQVRDQPIDRARDYPVDHTRDQSGDHVRDQPGVLCSAASANHNGLHQTDLGVGHEGIRIDCSGHPQSDGLFRRIGAGFCGSVWTQKGTDVAVKRADGAPTRYLWKEYYIQTRVIEAITRVRLTSIQVPHCRWYSNGEDHTWWSHTIPLYPVPVEACNAMCSDLILPLPLTFRNRLFDQYCPERLKLEVKTSEESRDCIARIYLGRRRLGKPSAFFSMRNIPLLLNQMEELDLPILEYSKIIAESLAIMHWEAEIDANDVEFVLGSTPPARKSKMLRSFDIATLPYNACTRLMETNRVSTVKSTNNMGQDLSVWLLDFDCCGRLTMDKEGIETAVAAFYRNDPYYPRPSTTEKTIESRLWAVFKESYLETGTMITSRKGIDSALPGSFIDSVEAGQQRNKEVLPAQSIASGFVSGSNVGLRRGEDLEWVLRATTGIEKVMKESLVKDILASQAKDDERFYKAFII